MTEESVRDLLKHALLILIIISPTRVEAAIDAPELGVLRAPPE
jgi:hypothetical protein